MFIHFQPCGWLSGLRIGHPQISSWSFPQFFNGHFRDTLYFRQTQNSWRLISGDSACLFCFVFNSTLEVAPLPLSRRRQRSLRMCGRRLCGQDLGSLGPVGPIFFPSRFFWIFLGALQQSSNIIHLSPTLGPNLTHVIIEKLRNPPLCRSPRKEYRFPDIINDCKLHV